MKGSQWHKWNLHVHTKGTNKNDQFKSPDMNQFFHTFFKKALANNIKAIGVTDYFSIDNYNQAVKYVQDISSKVDQFGDRIYNDDEAAEVRQIFLIPNVELRMMPSTSSARLVNIHCLFNPAYVQQLDNDFFATIENQERFKMNRSGLIQYGRHSDPSLTIEDQCYEKGVNNFVVEIGSLKELLDKDLNFKNNTIVVVSNSNQDGNSGLQKHYDLFEGEAGSLDGVRRTIYSISNAIFSANPKDISYFLGKRLDDKAGISDEEKFAERQTVIRERGSFKACLVGCDAHTEEHLFTKSTWIKGTLDFNGLRQIMFEPEQRVKIQEPEPDIKERKLIVDQVRFIDSNNIFTPEPIKFNRNLNVIIGGKSSGKSILLYNIAKTVLPDRSILRTGSPAGSYRYDFGEGFDFEVTIGSGHSQHITRSDEVPSILPEIKYIPQNYLSTLAEPENKKGNELVKLVRELLLEDDECNLKYQEFIRRVKSNDAKRELTINGFFDLQAKIADKRKELIQKGDPNVLTANIKSNGERITQLKEKAGLNEQQIGEYNKLSTELAEKELEITKLRSDRSKIETFQTDVRNVLEEIIQKKSLLLASLENEEVKKLYQAELLEFDNIYNSILKLIDQIELDEQRLFKQPNIFSTQYQDGAKRSAEIAALLQPYVQNQEAKKQIEALEKLKGEDTLKLSAISQLKTEIKDNENALSEERKKIFINYKENFEEYNRIITQLSERTKHLENDRLQIIGKPRFNFPRFRGKVASMMDGRKANFALYPSLDNQKSATTDFTIETLMSELQSSFSSMVEVMDFPFVSKVDVRAAVKLLLDDYFFDYWDVIYDNDELKNMSSGKASFVILMLIVGLSKSKAPILIDQPEDNLDNRSISKDLVEYLKNKKLERQVILVTHNANVVVNADAENVIVAHQKGQNEKATTSPYQFDYINGPIESTKSLDKAEKDLLKSMGIREHIADIVEGGEEAFKKREKKYGFGK